MAKGFTVKTVPPKPKKKQDEWDIPAIKAGPALRSLPIRFPEENDF